MAAPATLFRRPAQNGNHVNGLHINGKRDPSAPATSFMHLLPKPEQLPAWAGGIEIPKATPVPAYLAKVPAHTHLPGEIKIAALPPKPIKAGALKAVAVKTAAPANTTANAAAPAAHTATTTVPAKLPQAPVAQPGASPTIPLTIAGAILGFFIVMVALFNIVEAIGSRLSHKKAK